MLLDLKYLCCDFVLPVGEIPQNAVCRINSCTYTLYTSKSPQRGQVVLVLN